MARSRVVVAFVLLALGAAACASGSARADGPTTPTTDRAGSPRPTGEFDHVQLPLEDTSRPAVDPIVGPQRADAAAPDRALPADRAADLVR